MSYISEQELRNLINEGKTLYQISRQFNTTIPEIFKLGRSYGISFDYYHTHIPKPTKQDLESMYNDEGMTQKQIASEFGVTQSTVYVWFREYHIPTRGSNGTLAVPRPPKEVLQRMYIDEGMTQEQIGNEFGVSCVTVHRWLRYYNISTVGHMGAKVPIPPKDDLLNCINDGLNQLQIAEKYEVCDWKIYDWCDKLGIPGMVDGFRFTTPEHYAWRDAVLERDNYICQECGSQDDLRGHHIRPYCDYPELELDIDNGITLCKHCHEQTFGHEYQYIVKYEDIVLRDQCIGDCS